jgi:hypothetical protein
MYRRDRVARNACLASRLKPRLRYYRSLSAFPPLRQAKGPLRLRHYCGRAPRFVTRLCSVALPT